MHRLAVTARLALWVRRGIWARLGLWARRGIWARLGLWGVVGVMASFTPVGAAPQEPLAVRVNQAIDRGTRFLRARQEADGSYRGSHAEYFALGLTGLVVHALVKSGVSPTDSDLVRAVDFLASRRPKTVYDAAFVILGLDAAKDASRYPFLQETARWLLDGMQEDKGLWGYPQPPADLSNTQVALLALAAAAGRGVETPRAVYKAALRSLPAFRGRGNGYAYRAPPAAGLPTGSMTTAALTILHLVERGLEEQGGSRTLRKRAAKLADEAWGWMDRRFAADANPIGGHFHTTAHTLYYLYGVERAAALAGRRHIGGRDWYREGARFLVGTQEEDGSWGSTANTCFALLFLRRATFTSLGRTVEPLHGVGADDEKGVTSDAPAAPGRGVVPITHWLSLGPFPNPPDRDAPAVPTDEEALRPQEGRRVHRRRWTRVEAGRGGIKLPLGGTNAAHQLGYLGTWLHVAADTDVLLWIEQQGGVSVRLGGETVFERRIDLEFEPAAPFALRLRKGVTPLVLRWESWVGAARLDVRVSTQGGLDAKSVRWSLSPEGPDTAADLAWRPAVVGWPELFDALVLDEESLLGFDRPGDLDRVVLLADRAVSRTLTKTRPRGGAVAPDLSASGLLEVRPGPGARVTVVRKVQVPSAGAKLVARLALIGPQGRDPKRRIVARLGIYDGETTILAETPVMNAAAASRDPWATIEVPMPPAQGEAVLLLFLLVEVDPGTFTGADRLYVDEISVR